MRAMFAIICCWVLIVGGGCHREVESSTPTDFPVNLSVPEQQRPKTLEQAVDMLLSAMPPESMAKFAATSNNDLILYHHGLGTLIRNEYGLWKGNNELLTNCHAKVPDDASMVIIKAAWQKARTKSPAQR
jgi:hypothetical protein